MASVLHSCSHLQINGHGHGLAEWFCGMQSIHLGEDRQDVTTFWHAHTRVRLYVRYIWSTVQYSTRRYHHLTHSSFKLVVWTLHMVRNRRRTLWQSTASAVIRSLLSSFQTPKPQGSARDSRARLNQVSRR